MAIDADIIYSCDPRGQVILDPKTSKRIFELARDQQEELQEHDSENTDEEDEPRRRPRIGDDMEDAEDDEDEEVEEYVYDPEQEFVSRSPYNVQSIS